VLRSVHGNIGAHFFHRLMAPKQRSFRAQYHGLLLAHRYIVAETDDSLYVSFVGTKRLQDVLTDLNYWQSPLHPMGQPSSSSTPQDAAPDEPAKLLVHKGFMARAQGVPIEQLYQLALQKGKALLFCGASQLLLSCCLTNCRVPLTCALQKHTRRHASCSFTSIQNCSRFQVDEHVGVTVTAPNLTNLSWWRMRTMRAALCAVPAPEHRPQPSSPRVEAKYQIVC
jgi:hypothetical protein